MQRHFQKNVYFCTKFVRVENKNWRKKTMAKPIKETPILFGEDARRFEARMKEKRTETPEEREERMKAYYLIMSIMES